MHYMLNAISLQSYVPPTIHDEGVFGVSHKHI